MRKPKIIDDFSWKGLSIKEVAERYELTYEEFWSYHWDFQLFSDFEDFHKYLIYRAKETINLSTQDLIKD